MTRTAWAMFATIACLSGASLRLAAQAPADAPKPPLPDMPAVAAALGVTCDYCHAGRGTPPKVTANGKPRLDVAREMIAMTHALNATVQSAAGKTAREAAAVTCATCHRGLAIPRPLTDILLLTSVRDGADAAVAQYRELRTQHYGRGAYDFGENTLLNAARRLGTRPPRSGDSAGRSQPGVLPAIGEYARREGHRAKRTRRRGRGRDVEAGARDRTRERGSEGSAVSDRGNARPAEEIREPAVTE